MPELRDPPQKLAAWKLRGDPRALSRQAFWRHGSGVFLSRVFVLVFSNYNCYNKLLLEIKKKIVLARIKHLHVVKWKVIWRQMSTCHLSIVGFAAGEAIGDTLPWVSYFCKGEKLSLLPVLVLKMLRRSGKKWCSAAGQDTEHFGVTVVIHQAAGAGCVTYVQMYLWCVCAGESY